MDSITKTDIPNPPQLPKTSEVDKEVALKYLDMYHEYLDVYNQSLARDNKKKQISASSSRDSSVAPSQSASQIGDVIPGIVRTDSRSSLLTYTPPDATSAYTGLIVNNNVDNPGFCYLALVKPEHHDTVMLNLGRYPRFQDIMMMERSLFLEDDKLSRLQISRTAPNHYHVLTGTIMPSAVSTFAAIAEASCIPRDEGTLYRWAASVIPPEGLAPNAPKLTDILGSNGMYYEYSESYSPGRIEYTHRYVSPVQYRQPEVQYYQSRRPRAPVYRSSDVTSDNRRNRNRSPVRRVHRRERRDPSPETYYTRNHSRDYDRTLRLTAAEDRQRQTSQDDTYNLSSIGREINIIERSPATMRRESDSSREVSSPSHISSTASTSSIKVYGSLQGIRCGVCMEVIDEGAGFLRCGHVFHSECVDTWLESHNTCPECRAEQY